MERTTDIKMEENERKTENKRKSRQLPNKPEKMSKYMQLKILSMLSESGCTAATLHACAESRNATDKLKSEIIDCIGKAQEDAQQRVNLECQSPGLNSITEWLELLKAAELPTHCRYETAAVVNAIRNSESQPDPTELDMINMSEVYQFLERALLGQTQEPMNIASEIFLRREIELLIADANSDEADVMCRQMLEELFRRTEYDHADLDRCSIDPLFLKHIQQRNN